ncbi:hypothetical protein H7344_10930 [Nocardioides deserti]|uniref:Uncharacterized protein n=1 Tax=Nocardioides deserti TaxID=1588644 RepID=A0ABR6UAG6_9ACTN|nr:hypothetical protein [Nocardioides deserti]MBC2960806.1 hypothetical protein [Nocardioides deserti]
MSVTSLVAARHGSIAETFKNTHAETTGGEVGSSISAPATPLSPGLGLTSRTTSSRTTTQEVVRRAVVQGTFRSLRLTDTDLKLSVEDQQARRRPKPADTEADLGRKLSALARQRRAVRVSDLERGDVVELRVKLSADPTYQVTAAATSMLDLIKGRSSMFGLSESQFAEIAPALELIPQMLVDLVPINAQVVSHLRIDVDNEVWLVDAAALAQGSAVAASAETIAIAGVTELPLYWKDVRRVLFGWSEYTVYARLARSGLATSWTPVKLADVFDSIDKGIGDQLRQLPLAFRGMHKSGVEVLTTPIPEVIRVHGLIPFGQALARSTGRSLDEAALNRAAEEASHLIPDVEKLGDVGVTRRAFDHVVGAVAASPPLVLAPIDRELVAELREPFQAIAQLQAAIPAVDAAIEDPAADGDEQEILEAEFVAIYW